ncbi:MAG: DUF1311 domain-containing protein [Coxiellaceae bacterium]|nr:MAG: DUF1311 domain-containing protein [Coxiellaceae bacterium]
MKRIILTISLLTTSLCFANPSFDCQKAKTAAEKAICANTSLSDDDCQLGLYYQTLLAVNPANKTSLIQSQQQWLKNAIKQCKKVLMQVVLFMQKENHNWLNNYGKPYSKAH